MNECEQITKSKWEQVMKLAKKMYEEDDCGDWEEADKYEREDYVWAAYMKVKGGN